MHARENVSLALLCYFCKRPARRLVLRTHFSEAHVQRCEQRDIVWLPLPNFFAAAEALTLNGHERLFERIELEYVFLRGTHLDKPFTEPPAVTPIIATCHLATSRYVSCIHHIVCAGVSLGRVGADARQKDGLRQHHLAHAPLDGLEVALRGGPVAEHLEHVIAQSDDILAQVLVEIK
eukprot:4143321-Prymnesium_polylepis.1